METSEIVRLIMGLTGGALLVIVFMTYAKQKMAEHFAFSWAVLGVVMILISAVPALSVWSRALSGKTYAALYIVMLVVLWILFVMCQTLSEMELKMQELAMQVSLLNNENVQLLRELGSAQEKEEKGEDYGSQL